MVFLVLVCTGKLIQIEWQYSNVGCLYHYTAQAPINSKGHHNWALVSFSIDSHSEKARSRGPCKAFISC
jgi:hypothetical protein